MSKVTVNYPFKLLLFKASLNIMHTQFCRPTLLFGRNTYTDLERCSVVHSESQTSQEDSCQTNVKKVSRRLL